MFGVAQWANYINIMDEVKAVEIRAELRQLKTMVDGSVNVTINLPEDCREQAKKLMDWLGLEIRGVLELYDSTL
jgi:division protein CdvB (Snf7/Vps24/ESCRT-III family)